MMVRAIVAMACLPVILALPGVAAAQAPEPPAPTLSDQPSPEPSTPASSTPTAPAPLAQAPSSPAPPVPAPRQSNCFDIITLPATMQPYSPVMLNHCSGASWMLGHENIPDANGKPTAEFVYRWYPLNMSSEEAYLLKAGATLVPPVKAGPAAVPSFSNPYPAFNTQKKSAGPQ